VAALVGIAPSEGLRWAAGPAIWAGAAPHHRNRRPLVPCRAASTPAATTASSISAPPTALVNGDRVAEAVLVDGDGSSSAPPVCAEDGELVARAPTVRLPAAYDPAGNNVGIPATAATAAA
jgi:hypothetical protein